MASWNDSANYELNSSMKWNFTDGMPNGIPIWVLVEDDTCDPLKAPSVFRAIFDETAGVGRDLRLLDFDPKTEEEYLSGNMWNVVAWRHMTDHGGTWDAAMEKEGVTFLSNWKKNSEVTDPPRQARIAIATLYLRFRDARRYADRARRLYGNIHPGYVSLRDRQMATWNDLQAVMENVYNNHPPQDPKQVIRFATMRAMLDKGSFEYAFGGHIDLTNKNVR